MLTGRHPYQNACWTNSHILELPDPHLRPRSRRRRLSHLPGGADALPGARPAAGLQRAPGGRPLPQLRRQPLAPAGAPGRHGRPGPCLPRPLRTGAGRLPGARRGGDGRRGGLAQPPGGGAPQRPAGDQPVPFLRGLHAAPPAVRRPAPGVRALPGRASPAPASPRPSQPEHPYLTWWRARTGIESVTPEEEQRCRSAYWALVDRLDAMIGQVLRALEENGLAENTLVLYTTDHGEQAGEHGLWWKQTMHEASARVPAVVSWPGRPSGGPALRTRRQRPRPDGHHPGRGAGAGPARDGREEPAGTAGRADRRAGRRTGPAGARGRILRPSPAWEDDRLLRVLRRGGLVSAPGALAAPGS